MSQQEDGAARWFCLCTANTAILGSLLLFTKLLSSEVNKNALPAFLLQMLTSIAGPLSKGDTAQVTAIDSEALKLSENVNGKKSECQEGQHGEACCQSCPPGMLH